MWILTGCKEIIVTAKCVVCSLCECVSVCARSVTDGRTMCGDTTDGRTCKKL